LVWPAGAPAGDTMVTRALSNARPRIPNCMATIDPQPARAFSVTESSGPPPGAPGVLPTWTLALTTVKVAVTAFAAFMVRVQVPVPAQAPDQPVNAAPWGGVAVNVTDVPNASVAE